jgi:hypothetical protein
VKFCWITGKTNKWIKNFLSDRTQSVVVEGEISTSIPVEIPEYLGFRADGAICLPHLKSDEMVHPRYFADVSSSRICPCRV